jgi:hypothetical protein
MSIWQSKVIHNLGLAKEEKQKGKGRSVCFKYRSKHRPL